MPLVLWGERDQSRGERPADRRIARSKVDLRCVSLILSVTILVFRLLFFKFMHSIRLHLIFVAAFAASRSQDNDAYDDDESDASQESAEDVNDPMYDDMLRELEVVEEEEEVDRDEEGEDDTHLLDQLAECFHINTHTTRGGRQTKVPVKYT